MYNIYFIVAIVYFFTKKKDTGCMQMIMQLAYGTAFSFSFLITLFYWGFLSGTDPFDGSFKSYQNYAAHLFFLIILFMPLFFEYIRFELYIMFCMITVGLCYLVVNIAYSLTYEPVYKVLDWKSAASIGYFIGALLLAYIGYGIAWGISFCVKSIKDKSAKNEGRVLVLNNGKPLGEIIQRKSQNEVEIQHLEG